MINLSDRAVDELQQLRLAGNASAEQGVRLQRDEKGALGMAIEAAAEGDLVIRREDEVLLIMGSELAEAMDGGSLDYGTLPGERKERFTFRHRVPVRRTESPLPADATSEHATESHPQVPRPRFNSYR